MHTVPVRKQYLCAVCFTPQAKEMIALVFNSFISLKKIKASHQVGHDGVIAVHL